MEVSFDVIQTLHSSAISREKLALVQSKKDKINEYIFTLGCLIA